MTQRLIDTAQAGEILGVHYGRIRTLIRQGYLKDHNPIVEGKKKHFSKLDVAEVREFKKNYRLEYRTVTPRVAKTSINGNEVRVHTPHAPVTPRDMNVPVPASFKPITRETPSPVQSFNDRLMAIEAKIDILIKIWS